MGFGWLTEKPENYPAINASVAPLCVEDVRQTLAAEDGVCALQQLGSYQDLSAARTNQILALSQTGILLHENWTGRLCDQRPFSLLPDRAS